MLLLCFGRELLVGLLSIGFLVSFRILGARVGTLLDLAVHEFALRAGASTVGYLCLCPLLGIAIGHSSITIFTHAPFHAHHAIMLDGFRGIDSLQLNFAHDTSFNPHRSYNRRNCP